MTFKETDFPSLIKFLKVLAETETNPVLFKEAVLRFVKLYEDLPLYPGIVEMCVRNAIKKIDSKEIATGQQVFVQKGADCFVGIVIDKNADSIKLKSAVSVASKNELELKFSDMDQVKIINEKVLEELWPSLSFPKKS